MSHSRLKTRPDFYTNAGLMVYYYRINTNKPPFDEWRVELATAIAASSRRHAVAATHVAEQATPDPGLEKLGRSLDLPPWKKGRYGTAIGRAVHAVLQTADLRSGSDVADMAAAQAQAEGVAGHEDVVEALARAALGSETVAAAAAGEHWRELYVAAPFGDRLLEGYIDLLYELGDDLVVVDYKTDAWESEADLSAKINTCSSPQNFAAKVQNW